MKIVKKLVTMVLAATLVIGTAVTAFGATVDNVTAALTNAGASSTQIAAAKDYLTKNSFDATKLDTVVTNINEASATLKAAGITDLTNISTTKLTANVKAKVLANAEAAAAAVGATVNVTKSGDKVEIAVVGKDGSTVVSANFTKTTGTTTVTTPATTLQHTATNYASLLVAGFVLVLAAAASFIVLKKKEVALN